MSETVTVVPELLEATPEPAPFEGLIELSRNLQAIARGVLDPTCESQGLNRLSALVLLHLYQSPNQLPSHLSFALHAQRANIASTLRGLTEQELIVVSPSETDRRARIVNLTDKGYAQAEKLASQLEEERRKLEDRIPPEHRERLLEGWCALQATARTIANELEGAANE